VPASLPAGSAVEKPILAKTYAELALAGAAIFLADALGLRHLALQADVGFRSSSAGAHTFDFISGHKQGKVPEVTRRAELVCRTGPRADRLRFCRLKLPSVPFHGASQALLKIYLGCVAEMLFGAR